MVIIVYIFDFTQFLFLNIISSRPNSSSVGMNLEERQRQLLMKKKEIEESTLESSSRSLGLLYESEKVGAGEKNIWNLCTYIVRGFAEKCVLQI